MDIFKKNNKALKDLHTGQQKLAIMTAFFCLIGGLGQLSAEDAHHSHSHGKGLIQSSAEQFKKIEQTWPRIVHVKPNKIGVQRIQEHIKKHGLPDQELFAAKHHEEFVKVNGLAAPSQPVQKASTPLPSSVNNSTLPSFPPIGDQQDEGSCVAWATTYYQASHELGLLNGYNNKASFDHVLSPRWTYNLLNGGADGGLVPDDALNLLAQNGAVSISAFPYVDNDVTSWDLNPQDWVAALSNRMAPAQFVTGIGGQTQNLQTIKQLLTNGHVLTFATFIDSWVMTTIPQDPENPNSAYVGQQACSYLNGNQGGHCMTIVGYDDDIWIDVNGNGQVDSGERGAFLIANSWSPTWGNNGFIWISYDAFLKKSAVINGPNANRVAAASGEKNYVFSNVPKAPNYTPTLIGQFGLNQNIRNQISVQAGVSDTTQSMPSQTFDCFALMNQGGALEFDGSMPGAPETATFAVDLTDLLGSNTSPQRYYLVAADTEAGNPTTLTSFGLLDLVHNTQVNYSSVPLQFDNSQITPYIDYAFTNANNTPSSVADPVKAPSFTMNFNCGENAVVYSQTQYNGDSGYSSGSYTYANRTLSFLNPVYNSQRYGATFSYHFNVPNGKYTVGLKFAEIYFTQPNKRVFNVNVNGKRVLANLDLFKVAGFAAPYDHQVPVTVINGGIDIQFSSVINNASINAIEITQTN